MTLFKTILVCLVMCLFTGTVVYFLLAQQDKKIAVIDAVKLADNYNMKKELEAQARVKLDQTAKQIDSISQQVNLAKAAKNEEQFKKLTYAYNYLKDVLNEQYVASNNEINQQIWKRLNPALDEYGKRKNVHLIIGANGMGSVLYTDNFYDITDDAIKFINSKYEGQN